MDTLHGTEIFLEKKIGCSIHVKKAYSGTLSRPKSPKVAEVILSELVTRVDGTPTDSVRNVNKKLKKFCNQNGWRIIHHQNITANGLNRSGLHLNERGNNILFNNFVKFLDKSSHN